MARQLKNWIEGYLEYTANLESPEHLHRWAAVSTIASALRGKTFFNMGHFNWKPNFYITFVAPPGIVSKSTTIGIGHKLLQKIPGINFAPNSATWQALAGSMAEMQESMVISKPSEPKKTKTMTNVTLFLSELGTFLDLRDTKMMDVLVDWWDGTDSPWERTTQGGGSKVIHSPWLNLIGATTPSWLRENMPEYAIGGGFVSRTLFIYADKKERFIAYPFMDQRKDFAEIEKKLSQDLAAIANLRGAFTMTPEALAFGSLWYEEHWRRTNGDLNNPRLQGYFSRKQAHLHKLAMVLSAAESDSMTIDVRHLEQGLRMLAMVESQMGLVFQSIGQQEQVKYATGIEDTLKAMGEVTEQELFKAVRGTMDYRTFKASMQSLLRSGVAKEKQKGAQILLSYVQQ